MNHTRRQRYNAENVVCLKPFNHLKQWVVSRTIIYNIEVLSQINRVIERQKCSKSHAKYVY